MESSSRNQDLPSRKRARRSHADYTIACLATLHEELAPLEAMLDSSHDDDLPVHFDHNAYVRGEIGSHNVVLVQLPEMGTNGCAAAAVQLRNDFPNIRFCLLVGIAGGVPTSHGRQEVRLGDVIVGIPDGVEGGVVQFDRGRRHNSGRFERTGVLSKTPAFLTALVKRLRAQHEQQAASQIPDLIAEMFRKYPDMQRKYSSPGPDQDFLFEPGYEHIPGATCTACDHARLVLRDRRTSQLPQIHYGTIGSSNMVVRDAAERDRLGSEHHLLCIEMEAAGVVDSIPCLVIRGICDYADSHKNKHWQPYAATVAAAYAKELLQSVPASSSQECVNADAVRIKNDPELESEDSKLYDIKPVSENSAQQDLRTLIDSLAFERMDSRSRNISSAFQQTCKWLFNHETFKKWTTGNGIEEHHGFLWIKGKPGSGKSTIMKTALRRFGKKRQTEAVASYFFNARALDDLEKSSLGFYRSITYQLLQIFPNLGVSFSDYFQDRKRDGEYRWTVVELQEYLKHAVQGLAGPTPNIFVDALDEGDDQDVRQLIEFLEDLAAAACKSGSALRICLSSRHYPNINIKNGLSLVLEHQPGHREDIATYIRNKLAPNNEAEYMEMKKLQDKVHKKSSNVFLWVVLVIPLLTSMNDRGESIQAMSLRLEDIPKGLDGLFECILDRDKSEIDQCLTLLQWVLFSRRSLRPIELYSAVNTHFRVSDIPNSRLNRFILDRSRGLVEITQSKPPTIQFIHETVRTYLMSNGLARIDPRLLDNVRGLSHEKLKLSCKQYIEQNSETARRDELWFGKQYHDEMEKTLPFLEYAVNNLFWHAELAECNLISQEDFLTQLQYYNLLSFRRDWIQFRNGFQSYSVRQYTIHVSLLYLIVEQGLESLVEVLIASKVNVNVEGERYGSALQAACAAGHEKIAEHLLRAGARSDIGGKEFENALFAAIHFKRESTMQLLAREGIKPSPDALQPRLFTTVARGYLAGIEFLLHLGASSNKPNARQETPLVFAVKRKFVAAAELLIERGAQVQSSDKYEALYEACALGHEQLVSLLIEKGADVNSCGENGRSPLAIACIKHHDTIVGILIKNGANVNACDQSDSTPLCLAIGEDHLEIIRILVENGADPDAHGRYNATPLCLAVRKGHLEITRVLVENGADLNPYGRNYATPLSLAIGKGHLEIIRILVENGADVNTWVEDGRTPLCQAIRLNRLEIIDELLTKGAKIEERETSGELPLTVAISCSTPEIVRRLITHGTHVNGRLPGVSTPLLRAIHVDRPSIVRELLGNGASVDVADGSGKTPIVVATNAQRFDIVFLLIEHGASVKMLPKIYLAKILGVACLRGNKDVVRVLIHAGADVNTNIDATGTVLAAACVHGHEEVVRILIQHGANVDLTNDENGSALIAACTSGREEVVHILLQNGADVNMVVSNSSSGTALMAACTNGHEKLVRTLLQNGADASVIFDGSGYSTPLIAACARGLYDVIPALLGNGADINFAAKNRFYSTALVTACMLGYEKITRILLQNGADVDYVSLNRTALIAACLNGHENIVRVLVQNGVNVNLVTDVKEGYRALIAAIRSRKPGIVGLLLDCGADVHERGTRYSAFDAALKAGNQEIIKMVRDAAAASSGRQLCITGQSQAVS